MIRPWLIVISLMLAALMAGHGTAAEKVRFGTHFRANPHYGMPALAALDKGFWKDEGLEVEWLPFDSPATMSRAVAAGKMDAGTVGLSSLVLGIATRLPSVYVAHPGITTRFYLWALTASPVKEAKDLRGAKIGVTALGTAPHIYAQIVAKALGLEKQVKMVATGGGRPGIAALKAKAVDVSVFSDLSMAPLKAEGEVREIVAVEDYIPKGPAEDIMYAHREYLEKKPDAVKKVVRGFLKGTEYVPSNREWAIEKMKKEFGFPEKVARVAFPMLRYTPDRVVDPKKIEDTINFLLEYGLLAKDKAPPLEKIYARGFAD